MTEVRTLETSAPQRSAPGTREKGWGARRPQSGRVGLGRLCGLLGRTRQAYYDRQQRQGKQAFQTELVLEMVRRERHEQPRLGTRKLHEVLSEELAAGGIELGRDRFFDLLREHRMLLGRRRRTSRTTNSRHWYKRYENLLARRIGEAPLDGPNQAWASDLTYIRTEEGFRYLSLVTDAYSRKIVGYALSPTLETEGCLRALRMALGSLPAPAGFLPESRALIHHSDRGIQYCSYEYTGLLKQHGIQISMGEVGNPYENAIAERVNGILKLEYGLEETFESERALQRQLDEAVRLYNTRRPHLSLGMHTPEAVHRGTAENVRRLWKKPQRAPADGELAAAA